MTERQAAAPKWFTLHGPCPNAEEYVPVLDQYGEGWNTANLDMVIDCFSDDIEYRDFSTRKWLRGRAKLRKYVGRVFAMFPSQEWETIDVFPHTEAGSFSVRYRFAMAGGHREMAGEGYERIVVREGKICLDDVFLRLDAINLSVPVVNRPVNVLALARGAEDRLRRIFR